MVKGKNKGNAFELRVYKDLRELGDCKRTIGSGSSDEPGDILFKEFAIECKHYKELKWTQLTNFWNKLLKECKQYKQDVTPVIVFRENMKPIMVLTIMTINGKKFRGMTSYNIWKQVIR